VLHNTSQGDIDRVWRLPEQLRALRPEAVGLLELANECAWRAVDPALLEEVRLRAAVLLGNDEALHRRSTIAQRNGLTEEKLEQLGTSFASDQFSEREADCLSFVEQFVIDVSGVTQASLPTRRRHLAVDEVATFVAAVYVTEFTQRLEMIADRLLEAPAAGTLSTESGTNPVAISAHGDHSELLEQALSDYQDAVVRGTALDPVTTEIVRLRCARTHNCRICQTLRLTDALAAGADDTMTAKVDFYEKSDLDERTKTALRITDAFITRPDTLAGHVISDARTMFSQEELAELCLDITKWSTQKIHVALGTDGADALPKNPQGVSYFNFADDGSVAGFSATSNS
jgi:alkylhydroperoxidase family enzyme